jgi:3-hydroxybutyryl-CoA dehydrogenase
VKTEDAPALRIAVLGAGTMGGGIAAMLAAAGFDVAVADPMPEARARAAARIAKRAPDALVRLLATPEEAAAEADLVIEAAPERLDLKLELFRKVDAAAPAHAHFASNTSQFSVADLAAVTHRPTRVAGMHWFNPPERMQLIELVRTPQSSDATLSLVRQVGEACGKTVIEVSDQPGFVANRVMTAGMLEAMRMLDQNVASADAIDRITQLGLNHPMGPLALADYVGLDVMLWIAESLHARLGARFEPPAGLVSRVNAGKLGRKSGEGYFVYPPRA